MKKNVLFRAFAALSALMACMACAVTIETEVQPRQASSFRQSPAKTITITASLELPEDQTKTSLQSGNVVWSGGEQIKVFNAANTTGVIFTLSSGVGETHGTFTGSISGTGPFYAVYPASVATELTGSSVSITVPQVQKLTELSFGQNANISFATVESIADDFIFKNALGALKISVNSGINATRVRIQTKAAEPLWGSGTLSMAGETPSLVLSSGTTDNQLVEARAIDEEYVSGTSFYVMVPAGTMTSGFVVQIATNDGYSMVKQTSADNTIARSRVKAMPAFTFVPQVLSSFLDITPQPFGYYSNIQSGGTPVTLFSFAKATSQYAGKVVVDTDRTFRMQDFTTGKYYSFVLPYTLALGGSYDATVESVEGSIYTAATDAGSFTLVQKTANAGWFVKSDDNSKGFIFLLED